ncbi:hypothetical protein T492DRAFT_385672 [Pavlovales sp. CCMP2436]|nr:hypothetical protein T492DRAFT_385672 [Pavlovales sp. CCMP2436]
MTHWIVAATEKTNEKIETLQKYFERTGALLTINGEGDDLLKLEGKPKDETFDFMGLEFAEQGASDQVEDHFGDDGGNDDDGLSEEGGGGQGEEGGDELDDANSPADDEDIVAEARFELPVGWGLVGPDALSVLARALSDPLSSAGAEDAMVGRSILYRWPGVGWCSGVVSRRNIDQRRKVAGSVVNYYVAYETDGGDEAGHVLEANETLVTSTEATVIAVHGSWVLLEQLPV